MVIGLPKYRDKLQPLKSKRIYSKKWHLLARYIYCKKPLLNELIIKKSESYWNNEQQIYHYGHIIINYLRIHIICKINAAQKSTNVSLLGKSKEPTYYLITNKQYQYQMNCKMISMTGHDKMKKSL